MQNGMARPSLGAFAYGVCVFWGCIYTLYMLYADVRSLADVPLRSDCLRAHAALRREVGADDATTCFPLIPCYHSYVNSVDFDREGREG